MRLKLILIAVVGGLLLGLMAAAFATEDAQETVMEGSRSAFWPAKGESAKLLLNIRERGSVHVRVLDGQSQIVWEFQDDNDVPGIRTVSWNGMSGDVAMPSGIYPVEILQNGRLLKKVALVLIR